MKVRLMLTCLCDAFYGEVGIAAVKVLEAAGCEIVFDNRQTCCGQPPFNAGDWNASRRIAEHCLTVFNEDAAPIVTPSGSCAAMMREGYPLLFPDSKHVNCFEVGEFLVRELGIHTWSPGPPPTPSSRREAPKLKVAFHRACHGRSLGLTDEQETLVRSLPNVEIMSFDQCEQCCGFGGAFAATHGKISSGIGLEKLKNVQESGAEWLVSGDMGCLMHLQGLIDKNGLKIKTKHYLELLAEALPQ